MAGKDVLLRARSHFRASRTVEALRRIEVPEWDTTIHYWPAMSVEESREIGRFIRVTGASASITAADLLDASVAQLVHRARDQFGNRMFSDEDEPAIRGDLDEEVVKRIGLAMGFGGQESVEDAEKN